MSAIAVRSGATIAATLISADIVRLSAKEQSTREGGVRPSGVGCSLKSANKQKKQEASVDKT